MRNRALTICLLALAILPTTPVLGQSLVNSSFEDPRLTIGTPDFQLVDAGTVTGWQTTAGDNLIEIWTDNFMGVPAYDLDQHVELNANLVSTLYQEVAGIPNGAITSFEFAHRGRSGVDTVRMAITDLGGDGVFGGGDDTVLFTKDYATDNTAWSLYTSVGEPLIVALGNPVRFSFESVSAAGGNAAVGNFLDAVSFGIAPGVNLELSKTESADPVTAGSGPGNLTYVVTLANISPNNATGVEVTESLTLPVGVTVDSVTPSVGTYLDPTWTVGNLAAGASATLTVVLTIDAAAAAGTDVISDTASVTAVNETELDPSNDAVTESTSVVAAPVAAAPIPTLSEWGLIAFMLMLVAGGLVVLRRVV